MQLDESATMDILWTSHATTTIKLTFVLEIFTHKELLKMSLTRPFFSYRAVLVNGRVSEWPYRQCGQMAE